MTEVEPTEVLPSPKPEASHAGLEKNSTEKVVLAVELSEPLTVVLPPPSVMTSESVGKFCWLFAPVSGSLASPVKHWPERSRTLLH